MVQVILTKLIYWLLFKSIYL